VNRMGRRLPTALGAVLVVAACGSRTPAAAPAPVRPATGGGPDAATISAEARRRPYTVEDVRFMQHMIVHHAQALAMTALVPERTQSEAIRFLAERIEVSQRDEIALMQQWLRERGEHVPEVGADGTVHGAAHGEAAMPGMLTAEELARLEQARGEEFDRLFLELMIRHHEGALVMVGELFAAPGAGQDPEVFRLAMDVDADQRAEIRRMQAMLQQ
jgi:uncharacterized protein (DUF305 family)